MIENTGHIATTDDTGTTAEGADAPAERVPPKSLDDVPGWFHEVDQHLFHWFLNRQEETKTSGDIVELGVYLGKSTILIGEHLRPGDTFTVCDLFGIPAPDEDNHAESARSYKNLTREEFEFNYGSFHDEPPVIIQAATGEILDHVAPGSARFVHVDASHLYKHVRDDVLAARTMLVDDGIVVFDDYRSPHTPGVSAAVWEAVLTLGLKPIALSPQKFYGTWGDADSARRELVAWTTERPHFSADVQEVGGHDLVRVVFKPPKKPKPKAAAAEKPAPPPAKPKPPPPSPARKLARDLLPPIVTRTIRKARKANQAAKPPAPSPETPRTPEGPQNP